MESEPTETGAARIEATEETEATTYATLDEAIEKAKAGDTITLLADVKDAAIEITVSDLTLDLNGHTISGKEHPLSEHSSSSTPQPGGYTPAAITIGSQLGGVQEKVDSFTLKNGTVSIGSGLRIFEELGTLTLDRVTFENNVTANDSNKGGAAVYWRAYNGNGVNPDTSLIVRDCIFKGNEACEGSSAHGGAMELHGIESIEISRSTFTDNVASASPATMGDGGAIHISSCNSLFMQNCIFENNSASTSSSNGGAMSLVRCLEAQIQNCKFIGNKSFVAGALIISTSYPESDITVEDCLFSGNQSTSDGGAIRVSDATVTFSGNTVVENESGSGGAISITGNSNVIYNGDLSGNTATYGGAVYASGTFYVDLEDEITFHHGTPTVIINGDINNNKSTNFGGAVYAWGADVTVNGDICDNAATNDGGAIYAKWTQNSSITGPITLYSSKIQVTGNVTGNAAGRDGGAVYSNISYVTINGLVTGNSAGRNGGGVYSFNGSPEYYESKVDLTGASVYNNTAVTSGDDIYHDGGALALAPVGENWTLSGCGDAINGWYQDGEGARWTAHTEPAHTEEYLVTSDAATGLLALKAAHGVIVDPEPSDPEPENPPYIPDPDPSEPEEPSEPSEPGEEISDPETPQTSFPGTEPSVPDAIPGEPSAPSTEEIPDEDTPQTAQPPQTGARAAGSIVLLAGAAAAAAVNLRRKRK